MSPERWRELNRLLDDALALGPEQRPAFLDASCADAGLRREVEELLAYESRTEGFMQEPLFDLGKLAGKQADAEEAGGELGSRVGAYRLVELLGRGGMGEVYLAVRVDDFEQRVALKLLPRLERRGEVLRRFQAERQILARLGHPHIGRLLDGGTTADGRPYLVMEHIDGLPIDVYCRRSGLGLRDRLRLFLKVCGAVHAAHQQLVVHRDLKPSNILVTPEGEPKLLDFGIAKILEPGTGFETAPGASPMTLRYASPEQFRGQPISTATDVYALGVLLHRLLTERLPLDLDDAGLAEAAFRTLERDPDPPSQVVGRGRLRRRLRGDLDVIVLEALRKRPDERYGSAAALAEDVRRHLDGEPVSARRGRFLYPAAKLLRRYPWQVASVCLVLASTLSLVALEARRLQAERARAEKVTVFLEGLFYAAAPDNRRGGPLELPEILAHGRSQLVAFEGEPELYATLAGTLGRIHHRLGHLDQAHDLLRESLDAWRRDRPGDSPELARRLSNLGAALYQNGAYEEAERRYREALEVRRRLGQGGAQLVKTINNLAGVLALRGRLDEAEALYRQGHEIRRRSKQPSSEAEAASLRHLGYINLLRGELDRSESLLRQALARRLELHGERSTPVAGVRHLLSRVRLAAGDLEEAESLAQQALEVRLERLGDGHLAVARSRVQLAAVLLARGEPPHTAGILLTSALETLVREKPPGDWEIAAAEGLLGWRLAVLGRPDQAETCLRRSWETLQATRGDASFPTRQALERLRAFERQSALAHTAAGAASPATGGPQGTTPSLRR